MIPEHGTYQEFKRVLFALTMDPHRQDMLLSGIMERYGLNAQMLGRTGTSDPCHYALTASFRLSRRVRQTDIGDLFRKVACAASLWFERYELNPNGDPAWYHGIVVFFGLTPLGEHRRKYFDPPAVKLRPVEHYMNDVANRLRRDAEAENRRALAQRHQLIA